MSVDARFEPTRLVVIGFDAVASIALLAAATVAHRLYLFDQIAALCAWAAMLLSGAALVAGFETVHGWGMVAACAVLVLVNYGGYRLVGTGRGGFLAGSLFAGVVGLALAARAGLGIADEALGAAVSLLALLLYGAVPRLTTSWDRFALHARSTTRAGERDEFEDPFNARERDGQTVPALIDTVPTAEQVLIRGRAAAGVRSALYTGLGAAVVFGAGFVLAPFAQPRWTDLVFAVLCATVLALRIRLCRDVVEQAGVLVAASATVLLACVSATMGPMPTRIAGLIGLALIVVVGALAGAVSAEPASPAARHRRGVLLDYVDYLAVGALIPVAVAVVGGYARLRGMWA
jgi:hypothetical protein